MKKHLRKLIKLFVVHHAHHNFLEAEQTANKITNTLDYLHNPY